MKTCNKIVKIIIISLLLFININNVNAKGKAYTTEAVTRGTTDLTRVRQETDANDFVVCSYLCAPDNAGTDAGTCGAETSNFSAIYYNPDGTKIWTIRMNINLQPVRATLDNSASGALPIKIGGNGGFKFLKDKDADPVTTQYIFTDLLGTYAPIGGIYYEAQTGSNLNESWKNTEQYEELNTSFTCPQYTYYDHTIELSYDHINYDAISDKEIEKAKEAAKIAQDNANNDMEICYADNKKKCEKREEKKTEFGKANNLSYSLVEELNAILDEAKTELINMSADKILERSFGTKEDICMALRNNMNTELTNESTYENMLNEIIKSKIKTDSPNKNLINVENLDKLLIPEKGYNPDLNLKYNSESLTEKYNELRETYINKYKESLKSYSNECHVEIDEEEVEYTSNLLELKIEKITEPKFEIDKTPLDCDTLFADMADIIKYAYFVLEIIAILIVIIQTGLDYSKVFLSDDKDQLKKSNDKLIKRIIILVVLLLLPALTNFFLKLFKIEGFNSENPLCVEIKQSKKN